MVVIYIMTLQSFFSPLIVINYSIVSLSILLIPIFFQASVQINGQSKSSKSLQALYLADNIRNKFHPDGFIFNLRIIFERKAD